LAKAVFGGDHRPPSLDLVAQMARATEAETVEPEPAAAPESD
jgi:hypothetical protein